jgi:hypothetical protein
MPRDVIAAADKPKGWSMLKKASDARASLGKSRAIAALGRVGRLWLTASGSLWGR